MPFVPVANGVQCQINYLLDGIPAQNTLSFLWTGTIDFTPSDLDALGLAVIDWVDTYLIPEQTNAIQYSFVRVVAQDSNPGLVVDVPLGFGGSHSGVAVPNQVAMTCTLQSALTGRSNRGRYFVPALPTTFQLDQKTWNNTAVSTMNAAFIGIITSLGTLTWLPVIISRFHNGSARVAGVTTPIQSYRCNAGIVTQRRRLT